MGIFDFLKKKPKASDEKSREVLSNPEIQKKSDDLKPIQKNNERVKSNNKFDFNSIQFQQEACALALWKIKKNDYVREPAITELENIGLDYHQIQFIIEKVKPFLNDSLNETFASNSSIDNILFESDKYQEEILIKAENWYQKNILNY